MTVTLRVATVRRQRAGHTIFTGKAVDPDGRVIDARSFFVVTSTRAVLVETVEPGQWWTVDGPQASRQVDADGFEMTEHSVKAETATLERLSGEHLVTYLSKSALFAGVGMVKARRLWDALGDRLYEVLDAGDLATLMLYLTEEVATNAIHQWAAAGHGTALKWLQAIGLDVGIGRKVLQFHGAATPEKVQEDPYRLLSFCASWKAVDQIARITFSLAADDPRRIKGAVEEACYAAFAAGHTSVLSGQLETRIAKLLGPRASDLVNTSLSAGLTNGAFVIGPNGVQPTGAAAMERVVARFVSSRATRIEPLVSEQVLTYLLAAYEADSAIELNAEQRLAVEATNRHPIALITGGAGVGKTTVLKAMYRVFDRAAIEVVQMALAGRAAKRMQEATGKPASTVASFIRAAAKQKDKDDAKPIVVVIDEASMLDIVSMAAVCENLPASARLILLGDPCQLMPVGPGLVLHALTAVVELPHVELKSVKRYGGAILAAALAVRAGQWPQLTDDVEQPISFLPCNTDEGYLADLTVDLYALDPEHTQILVSKKEGAGGAKLINEEAQHRFAASNPAVLTLDRESTGLHVGDPVLCTRNLWDHGLQNGSMGLIVRLADPLDSAAEDVSEPEARTIAWVKWDDEITRPLLNSQLDDMTLGYAITVHKAQGSQWRRIIIPVTRNRMLDRSLLYTAITRAQAQVILIGDEEAARQAVEAAPRSKSRQVALDLTVRRLLMQARASA